MLNDEMDASLKPLQKYYNKTHNVFFSSFTLVVVLLGNKLIIRDYIYMNLWICDFQPAYRLTYVTEMQVSLWKTFSTHMRLLKPS